MRFEFLIFAGFVFLTAFNAGAMLTLQIQHYSLYPLVGRDGFSDYLQANNRAALLPAVLPGMLLLASSLVLTLYRLSFVTASDAIIALSFNLISLFSTFRWQRPIQSEMALSGYDEGKIHLLIATNWVRTLALIIQAAFASCIGFRQLIA